MNDKKLILRIRNILSLFAYGATTKEVTKAVYELILLDREANLNA